MKNIAIIDYSIGNLFSVFQACKTIDLNPQLVESPADLDAADGIILPGVGAFGKGIENLHAKGLTEKILSNIKSGKPFFGICLGMQLLFENSAEFGESSGLGVVPGSVRPLRGTVSDDLPVPKTTWSEISPQKEWANTPLQTTNDGTDFYFVHSFYCDPSDSDWQLSTSNYGDLKYCSAVRKDNVFATQFHPEKSGKDGLKIYENWKNLYLN